MLDQQTLPKTRNLILAGGDLNDSRAGRGGFRRQRRSFVIKCRVGARHPKRQDKKNNSTQDEGVTCRDREDGTPRTGTGRNDRGNAATKCLWGGSSREEMRPQIMDPTPYLGRQQRTVPTDYLVQMRPS